MAQPGSSPTLVGAGSLAQFTAGTPVNHPFGEPEQGVLYRVNCVAYTSGTIANCIASPPSGSRDNGAGNQPANIKESQNGCPNILQLFMAGGAAG